MLKKFVSSLLVVALLTGCGAKNESSSAKKEDSTNETTTTAAAQDIATEIVTKLGIDSKTEAARERIILGMVFSGEEIAKEAAMYLSTESGNSDSVGVFVADDMDACKKAVEEYLDGQKENAATYNQDQVFKITNAVIVNNDKMLIMIVCDDIEAAKKIAATYID